MIITIEKFQEISKLEGNDLATDIMTVAIAHGMSEQDVRQLSIENFTKLRDSLPDATPPDKLIQEFEIDNVKYKVDTIFKHAGQFMDFSELNKKPIENLHLILAMFAYEGYYMDGYKERAEIFRTKCDYKVAHSVAFFFSRLMRELSLSAKIYSQEVGRTGTPKNGGGLLRWMGFQKGTVQNGTSISA